MEQLWGWVVVEKAALYLALFRVWSRIEQPLSLGRWVVEGVDRVDGVDGG